MNPSSITTPPGAQHRSTSTPMTDRSHSPNRSGLKQSAALRAASAKLAAALMTLSGLASSAYAQATWVGDTSQDWNNAANWSTDPASPTGAFTINSATVGIFPVVSATSAFTPTDIVVGSGTGQVGRLDVTSGTLSAGATNWLSVGNAGGTGTVNISTGATVNARLHLARGTSVAGTATVNVSGTLTSNAEMVIADGQNNATPSVGTLNVLSGGVVNSENDFVVAFAGNTSTVGTVNIETGAIVNVASATERWVIVSRYDAVHGNLNVNGGTLNINSNTDIRFNTGGSLGSNSLSLNGGAINGGATSVIDLNTAANNAAVNNTLNLNGGTLTIGQIISGVNNGTRTINFNGATVRASAASVNFMPATAASVANVKAGGAIFDSNGFDITVAETLVADAVSIGGGLSKLGAGTLTLTAAHTYLGDTTVSGGTLVTADNASLKFIIAGNGVNNKVTGTGAVTLNGDFEIDLAGAATAVGSSWQLVNVGTLTETYGSTFTILGFTVSSGKWLKQANGTFYQFDPATGVLSVVNNPTVPPPTVTPGATRATYATGSAIYFSVTASGAGTLSYQWYFQATGAPSPALIGGATAANYTVPNAGTAAVGVYSVVVTDSASNQPTTQTFPAFTLQPGTAFSVAYYRFEEGPDTSTITATNDSVGTNHLTVLGTPNYASDSLPYTTIPRTGASNTLGANFPASNNGLVAPTGDTLASTALLDFTIEAFVRLDSLAGWQTIVGRDDDATGQSATPAALFYLSKAGAAVGGAPTNSFRVELFTKDNTNIQVNSSFVPAVGTWYHVAAVGDATKGTLTLYVNGTSVGSATGFTGLFVPTAGSDTPWTLGRGDYNVADVDFLRGDLDEVRFSSAALPPSQFLASTDSGFVIPPVITRAPASQTLRVGDSATLSVTATGGTLSYEWYRNEVLISGQTSATLALNSVTTDNEGTYRVKVIDAAGAGLGIDLSTSATAIVRVLNVSTASRALGLNFVGAATGVNNSAAIGSLAPATSAGFVAAVNWNNSGAGVATQTSPLTLLEKSGATPSYTTATWSAANTWAARTGTGDPSAVPSQKTPDTTLLHGYIESRATTGASIAVANIPYGTYDVYVYVAGGTNGTVGSLTLDRPGSATYYYRILQNDSYVTNPVTTASTPPYSLPFVIGESPTRAAALDAPPATFVRFTGVTGADLTISAIDSVLNANSGGIAAVQIVDTTPAGTAYPPTVTSTSAHQLVKAGVNVTLAVTAVAANSGGVLTYQWSLGGSPLSGATSATLPLTAVTSANTGAYTVAVTETSPLGVVTVTRAVDLTVLDSNRSLLINGDIGTSAPSAMPFTGVLLSTGSVSTANVGLAANTWNNLTAAAGTATRVVARESTGLSVPGITFSYTGVEGSLDNIDPNAGAINATNGGQGTPINGTPILRDFAYTDNQVTPLVGTIGGLNAFAGKRVTLVVYAVGATSTALGLGTVNDAATITLAAANNYLATGPIASSNADSRDLAYNALAFVTFDAVVAPEGTVSWSLGADVDAGRIPLNGFQLLITNEDLAPPAPTTLAAAASGAAINLTWSASTGATSYTIKRGTTAGGPYSTISLGAVLGTSYSDTSVTAGTTYYYVISAVNAIASSADSNQASATANSALSALQTWRQANFGVTTNTGNAADTFDADFDGLPNLLEYALGTNPNATQAGPVVAVSRTGDFLKLDFTHIADATLVYTVEGTNEVTTTWSTVHTFPAFGTAGAASYTDTVSLVTQPRRFLRLRVTAP